MTEASHGIALNWVHFAKHDVAECSGQFHLQVSQLPQQRLGVHRMQVTVSAKGGIAGAGGAQDGTGTAASAGLKEGKVVLKPSIAMQVASQAIRNPILDTCWSSSIGRIRGVAKCPAVAPTGALLNKFDEPTLV